MRGNVNTLVLVASACRGGLLGARKHHRTQLLCRAHIRRRVALLERSCLILDRLYIWRKVARAIRSRVVANVGRLPRPIDVGLFEYSNARQLRIAYFPRAFAGSLASERGHSRPHALRNNSLSRWVELHAADCA